MPVGDTKGQKRPECALLQTRKNVPWPIVDTLFILTFISFLFAYISQSVTTTQANYTSLYCLEYVGIEKRFKNFVGLFITTRELVTSVRDSCDCKQESKSKLLNRMCFTVALPTRCYRNSFSRF